MVHGRPLKLSWGKESGREPAQGGYAPQPVAAAAPQDPAAAAAAMAAWQAQYGAQWAAYVQQQQAMQQKQGVGAAVSGQQQQPQQ